MLESRFFRQPREMEKKGHDDIESKEKQEPKALIEYRKFQQKAQEIHDRIKGHEEYLNRFYSSLNKTIETTPAEGSEKISSTVQRMQGQYDVALEREKRELEKVEAEIESLKKYIRSTLNIEPPV